MKRALITGITGQDGAYLAAFLLEKGYKVFGKDLLWFDYQLDQEELVRSENHPKLIVGILAPSLSYDLLKRKQYLI